MPGGFPLGLEISNANNVGANTATSLGTQTAGSGGSPNTPGAWTQLIASTAADAVWVIVFCQFDAGNVGDQLTVDIGVGGSGSEIVLIPNLQCPCGGAPNPFAFQFPLAIPAGTRIAARTTVGNFNVQKAEVSLMLFDAAFTQMEGGAGVDVIGQSGVGSPGTIVTASGSINTKGSYAQLTASTAKDYMGFVLAADWNDANATTNSQWLTDIAIGAGGSETIILPNLPMSNANGGSGQGYFFGINGMFMPIPIPAGKRIAARSQCTTASGAFGLQLYGVYQ